MKKIFALLLAFNAAVAFSQEITFNLNYVPNRDYKQQISQTQDLIMKFSGPSDMIRSLEENGLSNPTVNKTTTVSEVTMTTGSEEANGSFPFTITFESMFDQSGRSIIPEGTRITGSATRTSMPKLDSISNTTLDPEFKKGMMETMKAMMSQLELPSRSLRVGEKFTEEKPLEIPMVGESLKMTIALTYKLKSVKGNLAYLDVDTKLTMDTNLEGFENQSKGWGTGSIVYDTQAQFISRYDNVLEMSMKGKIENVKMTIESKVEFHQVVSVFPR